MELVQQKKRTRKANFTHREIMLLLQEVSREHGLLSSIHSNDITKARKKEAWRSIAKKLSSCGVAVRDIIDVRDKWKNLKREAQTRASDQNKTGGGLAAKPSPYDKMILTILNQNTPITEHIPNVVKPAVCENGTLVVVLNPSYSDNLPDSCSCSESPTVSRKRIHSQSEPDSQPDSSLQPDIKHDPSLLPDIKPDLSQLPKIQSSTSQLPNIQSSASNKLEIQSYSSGRSDTPTLRAVKKRAATVKMDITDEEKEYFQTQTQVNRALLQFLPLVERVMVAQERLLMLKARKLEQELQSLEEKKN